VTNKTLCAVAVVALSLTACSSKPRYFEPQLAAAPEDPAKYQEVHDSCRKMVAEGQTSGFGARVASGGVGVAAGVGVTAAAFGGTTYGSMAAAATAASAALVMMPVIGVAAAWGVAKANKAKKEKATKAAMTTCLSELGYTVSDWKTAKRPKNKNAAAPTG